MKSFVDYLPILTTLFAVYFTREIFAHYRVRKKKHILWWTIGVFTYGLGTLAESIHALAGWSEFNMKYWYITGALLGGFPLAQGSVYLLMKQKFADITALTVSILIVLAGMCIILSPVRLPSNFDYRLTGEVLEWAWVRAFVPFINLYSFIFLFGGAVYSAIRYYGMKDRRAYFRGNIFIAVGALLPGIGGSFARTGGVRVLFVTELLGLILIYTGYRIIKISRSVPGQDASAVRN